MWQFIIFPLYLFLLAWIIRRSAFFTLSGIPKHWIYVAFAIKILAGLCYAYIHGQWYQGGDAYDLFKAGKQVYSALFDHPSYYFRLVFGPNGGFVELPLYQYVYGTNWHYTGYYSIVRFHALLHLISFGYYSIHILCMAFLMLIASTLLYKTLCHIPRVSLHLLWGVVFIMPSLVFWTSGIHKDGMSYLGLSSLLYAVLALSRRFSVRHLILFTVGLGIVLLVRAYLGILLLPTLIALLWTLIRPQYPMLKFILVGGISMTLAFAADALTSRSIIFDTLLARRAAFSLEAGGSAFATDPLLATPNSFLAFLPTALTNALLQPFWTTLHSPIMFVAALSVLGIILYSLITVLLRKHSITFHPLLLFLFTYAIANLLLIGCIVSNAGTIARYRVIAMNYLLIVLTCWIDGEKLKRHWDDFRKFTTSKSPDYKK